jgi:hypothetical protein
LVHHSADFWSEATVLSKRASNFSLGMQEGGLDQEFNSLEAQRESA